MESVISLNYNNVLEINTNPGGIASWARIHMGFANLAEALNEVLYQASFLGDAGWGRTEVTGGQWTCTLTGVRYFGDEAQDFIFSDEVKFAWGRYRKTQIRITRQSGEELLWPVTLANITEAGGDSNQPGAITVTIHGNGPPTVTAPVDILGTLTVVTNPVIGTPGDSWVYVNPPAEDGNTRYYYVGFAPVRPEPGVALGEAWASLTSEVYDVVAGQIITVCEATTDGKLPRKVGSAVIYTETE